MFRNEDGMGKRLIDPHPSERVHIKMVRVSLFETKHGLGGKSGEYYGFRVGKFDFRLLSPPRRLARGSLPEEKEARINY